MLKLLHISDIHINKSFATKDEVLRHKLQRAVIKSFQNAIQYVISHELDGLIIAGDLFDSQHITLRDGEIVRDAFEQLNKHNIPVFYASGNHDFTHYDSKIRQLNFPKNVCTFFDDQPEMYEVKNKYGQSYKVVGCGHMIQQESRNLIEQFPTGRYIGVAHSMVQSSITKGDEGDYLPSTIETISHKGYMYFALGHIHQNGPIDKHETIYYSGSIQGLNSNEIGLKGGNLVVIEDDIAKVQFIPLCSVLFDQMMVDVGDTEQMEEVLEKIEQAIKAYGANTSLENVSLTLTLTGRTKMYRRLNDKKEIGQLKSILLDYHALFDVKIKSQVKTLHHVSEHMNQQSVLGEVLKSLKDMEQLPPLDFLSDVSEQDAILEGLQEQILDYFMEDSDEN